MQQKVVHPNLLAWPLDTITECKPVRFDKRKEFACPLPPRQTTTVLVIEAQATYLQADAQS
jgi:hypothetical protein